MKKGRCVGNGGPKSVRIEIEQQNHSADFSSPSTSKLKSSQRPTKRRSRSKVIARPSPSRSRQREVAVYDGQNLVGTVKVASDGKAVAYDARGKRLGSFPTFQAASAAFEKPSTARVAGG
jgi:hypothetical protein